MFTSKIKTDNGKKFYTDSDFILLIDELLGIDIHRIDDFLEYHYSNAFPDDNRGKLNWLISLRKNIYQHPKKSETGTPLCFLIANKWERDKTSQIVKDVNKIKDKPQVENKKQDIYQSFSLRGGTIEKGTYQDILDVLRKGILIKQGTKTVDFKKIFSGNEVQNKIEWVGSIPSLHDFVVGIWKFQNKKHGIWKTALNCFFHSDNDLKNLHNNKRAISKTDASTLENAMKYFKNTTT